jgi:hypothetical protein
MKYLLVIYFEKLRKYYIYQDHASVIKIYYTSLHALMTGVLTYNEIEDI